VNAKPPIAARREHVDERHGESVVDPYHWLRDDERKDPAVLAYLEAENAHTRDAMQPAEPLHETLYREMVGRIQETDVSAPVRKGPWLYYTRTEQGRQYRIHCRKRETEDAPEQILLDCNALARGRAYLRLGAFEVSPRHDLLAYSTDFEGDEEFVLRFKDLASGELLPDEIPVVYYPVVWANDNRTVFYTTLDETHRPWRLYRHVLGRPREEDVLVYEEADRKFFLGVHKSASERLVMLDLHSAVTTEQRWVDADRPEDPFQLIEPRRQKVEYTAEHWEDRFFILTNDEAVNFKLVEAPLDDPSRAAWRAVVEHRPEVKLEDIVVFREHLVLVEREEANLGLRIFELPGRAEHRVSLPEPVHTVEPVDNVEYVSETLRFCYESPVTPRSIFDYDMRTRERVLRKRQEVLGGYDPAAYECARLFALAPDGKRVPVWLVARAGTPRDGSCPALLYAYGAYAHTIDPGFSSERLSLLDRGFVFAVANVRGGGAYGRPWYDDGKLLRKRNTFDDFVAAAEHLVALGYTSPARLGIRGGSAGGLLIGAVINERPDLFRAAVANVPFVDVINTMFDPTIPLTVIEWEEWGDPRDRAFYEYMRSYSPYDNVRAQDYPALLVTAGLMDPRVGYWEPAKWVARLRAMKTDERPLLLKTHLGAGHSGPSGRYDALRDLAFEYAFLLTQLGFGTAS
jgi:oligopeptidase B